MGKRTKSALVEMVLLASSLLVALAIGEVVVRGLSPQFLRTPVREPVGDLIMLRRNLEARFFSPGEYDVRAHINGQRFRSSRDYDLNPPAGTLRIATLGDSFAFGTGVDDAEAYPALLERILNEGLETSSVEVINAGIHGTGTGNQVLWYVEGVRRFHPRLVILSLYANDLEDEVREQKFELAEDGSVRPKSQTRLTRQVRSYSGLRTLALRIPGYDFLCENSHLLSLFRRTATLVLTGRKRYSEQAASRSRDIEGIDQVVELLDAEIHWLRQRLSRDGVQLLVIYIPEREFFEPEFQNTQRVVVARSLIDRLTREAAEGEFAFLSLVPAIQSYLENYERSPYFERDFHFRREGHSLAAWAIARYLFSKHGLGAMTVQVKQ